jgi:hypothetical protein
VPRSSQGRSALLAVEQRQHRAEHRGDEVVHDDRGGSAAQQQPEREALQHRDGLREDELSDLGRRQAPAPGAADERAAEQVAHGGGEQRGQHGQQADRHDAASLASTTRTRLGSRVKVPSAVRCDHSVVIARMASSGSSRLSGVEVTSAKPRSVSSSASAGEQLDGDDRGQAEGDGREQPPAGPAGDRLASSTRTRRANGTATTPGTRLAGSGAGSAWWSCVDPLS